MAINVDCNIQPNGTIPADTADLFALFRQLCDMHAGTPLSEFLLDKREPPAGRFLYRITAADGREWKQYLHFDGSADSIQTFDVNPGWRPSEYVRHRPVRNAVLSLLIAFPSLETIRYTFT